MIDTRLAFAAVLLGATTISSCRQRTAQSDAGALPAGSSASAIAPAAPPSVTPVTKPDSTPRRNAPTTPASSSPAPAPAPSAKQDKPCTGEVCVTGTMRHMGMEGGFWAIRGDDGVTYDPIGSVPDEFKQEGLRVRLDARPRRDMGSIHMAGPLVEIISIRKVDAR